MLETLFIPKVFAQTASALFFAILFLQSGLDKVIDWKGNRDWIIGHFSKTPLAIAARPMLIVLTIIETLAGLLCLLGLIMYWWQGLPDLLIVGFELSMLALLMLFFGQRLAKDYPGAQSIAIYFGVCLLALYLMHSGV